MGLFKRDVDGAKTLVYTGGSSTVLLFIEAAKRRKRIIGILVVVLGVVGAVGFFAFSRYLQSQAAQRVVLGYSDLSRCLVGEPLKGDESPSLRFRRSQLTALTGSDVKRGQKGADPWPDRCLGYALRLQEGLEGSAIGKTKGKELLESTKQLAARLKKKEGFHRDSSALVDAFFSAAKSAQIAQTTSTVKLPPKATTARSIDDLKASLIGTKAMDLGQISASLHSGPNVHLTIPGTGDGAKPKLCVISASSARCQDLPVDQKPIRLVGTAASGLLPLVAAKNGRAGVFTSDGKELTKGLVLAGHVASDNYAAALVIDGKQLLLAESGARRTSSSRLRPPAALKLAAPSRDSTLLWEYAAWVGRDRDGIAVATAPLQPKRRGLGRARIVAQLPKATLASDNRNQARIDGCRGDNLVLRLRGKRKNHLIFKSGDDWSKAVATASSGGTLSCYGNEASVTRFWSTGNNAAKGSISHARCTSKGCSTKRLMVRELLGSELGLAPADTFHVVVSNGNVLVLWLANLRAGLRLRTGTLSELPNSSDQILFDNFVVGGKVVDDSTLLDLRLVPATGFSLLMLNTTKGLALMRISSEGAAQPLKL